MVDKYVFLLDELFEELQYFFKCCVPYFKENRGNRLQKIGHCKFWFVDKEFSELENEHSMLPRTLIYADNIYTEFEKEFGFCKHKDYCIYHNEKQKFLRKGVNKIGKTLHAICENPLELIMYRAVGISLLNNKILEEVISGKLEEPPCKNSNLDDVKNYLKNESNEAKMGRFKLRKEQFLKHYFEVTSLRDILSEKILSQERLTSSLKSWIGVFGSVIISGIAMYFSDEIPNLVSLTVIIAFIILLAIAIVRHISASIQLNEAKDVMYLCLGVDIDNPEICSTLDP